MVSFLQQMVKYLCIFIAHSILIYTFTTSETNNPKFKTVKNQNPKKQNTLTPNQKK